MTNLKPLEERGRLMATPQDDIYVGQIVGECSRAGDLEVNPTKAKNLTNHRAAAKDDGMKLQTAIKFDLERAIEY